MEKIFERATRGKYRFNFKGLIGVEDLWDLKLTSLDFMFKNLNKELKTVEEESLLNVKSSEDNILDDKIAIVKYIVKTKQEEEAIRKNASAKKVERQRILELIKNKEDAQLGELSVEELKAKLESL